MILDQLQGFTKNLKRFKKKNKGILFVIFHINNLLSKKSLLSTDRVYEEWELKPTRTWVGKNGSGKNLYIFDCLACGNQIRGVDLKWFIHIKCEKHKNNMHNVDKGIFKTSVFGCICNENVVKEECNKPKHFSNITW